MYRFLIHFIPDKDKTLMSCFYGLQEAYLRAKVSCYVLYEQVIWVSLKSIVGNDLMGINLFVSLHPSCDGPVQQCLV